MGTLMSYDFDISINDDCNDWNGCTAWDLVGIDTADTSDSI